MCWHIADLQANIYATKYLPWMNVSEFNSFAWYVILIKS